jgi:hypothetical protein
MRAVAAVADTVCMTKISAASPSTSTQPAHRARPGTASASAEPSRKPATATDVKASRTKADAAEAGAKQRSEMQSAGRDFTQLQTGVKRALDGAGDGLRQSARADGSATSDDKPQADLAQATQNLQHVSNTTAVSVDGLGRAAHDHARR